MVLQSMKMLRVLFIALAVLSVVPSAWSADLDSLRRSGAVGEKYDGLAVARDGSASEFVSSVNAQRSKIYQQRAAKEGVTAQQVGQVYAKQMMAKAPAGTWFLLENGSWAQK
ncbi:YdbL family protein [Kiloniella sp.]|uniref:YdbL family protein n=1 Tax=Kiloniella sp. TaxID=1938587 RepID=UPI003B025021